MEISSTREAISAESTHETKTTAYMSHIKSKMSDNAILLDIITSGKWRRLPKHILAVSAANACAWSILIAPETGPMTYAASGGGQKAAKQVRCWMRTATASLTPPLCPTHERKGIW